ncbi:MAG TPA: carboxypeptidase-like regulatory domain-containing protein, partial [Candidatus Acidoferrum sp.]|nr:carboxypeptidase-like regulatory domain-containing protein [Candidatus Acidoferrum sp.]
MTAAFLLLSSAVVYAQSGNSVISGTVKDASDAAIPNAKIQIANIDTGVKQETTSNQDGLYRIPALVPGSYRVEADAAGFDHLSRGPIVVQVSQTLALDLTLQVGQHSTAITVADD